MSNGRVDSRFEITHPDHGLFGTERSFTHAKVRCGYLFLRPNFDLDFVYVYDVMAKVGARQLWKITRRGDVHLIGLRES